MPQDGADRRAFLKAAGGAVLTSSLCAGKVRGANDKISLGFLGVGRMGSANIGYAAKVPGFQISVVCDVYQPALERAQVQAQRLGFHGVKAVNDFREILADPSIDAVCISAPDHWHPYMTVEACKAGKDVYVEEPAFVCIDEGPTMVEAARKYKRVVQAGTMQRSGKLFQKAREIVKSGDLGDITFCRTFQAGTSKQEGWGKPPDTDPPQGLDWDLWLGPAPNRRSTFRYFRDYAGGAMTDWGVHLLDIVQFAYDEAMPVSISAQGGKFYADDNVETPDTMMVTFRYPAFVTSYESRTANPYPMYNNTSGTSFHGTLGTLMVNRGCYSIFPNHSKSPVVEEKSETLSDVNVSHWNNWLECIKSREKPIADIETCVRTTATCVLANLSLRHGVTLDWDEKAFTVKQAAIQPFLKYKYRSPWKLEV
jgi:predicted dehydrogenase